MTSRLRSSSIVLVGLAACALLAVWWLSPRPLDDRAAPVRATTREPTTERTPDRTPPPSPAPTAPIAPVPAAPEAAPSRATAPADAGRERGDVELSDVEPTPEFVQMSLEVAIADHLPGHKLSSEEIAAATDALVRVRTIREELSELPIDAENAARRAELQEGLGRAVDDFEYVMEMSLAEFTATVQPGIGLSGPEPDEAPPEPEYLKDLPRE